jgi:hypothetical protein
MKQKLPELTYVELEEVIAYDPEAGTFVWKKDVARNIKAGTEAGGISFPTSKTNGEKPRAYRYIRYKGREMVASRVAWMLFHKEWPPRSVQFVDGDSSNLKITNLRLAKFPSKVICTEGRRDYRQSKEAMRHYGLTSNYGISLTDYSEMYKLQDGRCAICDQPETGKDRYGNVRPLAVDHCHDSGKVRGLLCYACNSMLGQAKDRVEVLAAGIEYLTKHSKDASPAPEEHPGTLAPQTGPADTARIVGRNLVQEEGLNDGLHNIHGPS